jgi:hypothetical protein
MRSISIEPFLNTVFHEDTLDLLGAMPTGCVDVVMADAMFGTVKEELAGRPIPGAFPREGQEKVVSDPHLTCIAASNGTVSSGARLPRTVGRGL